MSTVINLNPASGAQLNVSNNWIAPQTFSQGIQQAFGTNIASANDTVLPANGDEFLVTGNVDMHAMDVNANWAAGKRFVLFFTGTQTLKHNTAGGAGTAKFQLDGSIDVTTVPEMVMGFLFDGTDIEEEWRKAP